MRKKVYTVTVLVAMSLMSVSCQKESFNEQNVPSEEAMTYATVTYSVDGVVYTANAENETDYDALIARLIAMAGRGHQVSFCRGNSISFHSITKEEVIYTTSNYNDAQKWSKEKMDAGYLVTVVYDEKTGIYTCLAVK